jgi:hypothetical protein
MSGNLGDRPLPRPSRSGRYLAAIAVGSALSIPVGEVLPLARIASHRIIGTATSAARAWCPPRTFDIPA